MLGASTRHRLQKVTRQSCGLFSTARLSSLPRDLLFLPQFFSQSEQYLLLSTALQKLDNREGRLFKRRRKEYLATQPSNYRPSTVANCFLPDELYDFEEGHFDGVIKRFREMHVSSWPEDNPDLFRVLDRLKSVHPAQPTQTHILHLASDGEIYPHVDNVEASGSWILGVSLGQTRVLRLEHVNDPTNSFELALPSGSVYLQRDSTRYDYKHSILRHNNDAAQRLSIMIRDRRSEKTVSE